MTRYSSSRRVAVALVFGLVVAVVVVCLLAGSAS